MGGTRALAHTDVGRERFVMKRARPGNQEALPLLTARDTRAVCRLDDHRHAGPVSAADDPILVALTRSLFERRYGRPLADDEIEGIIRNAIAFVRSLS
jgi:hypothetical protein